MATSSVGAVTAGGLDFQSLLKIILTQLTYQDPLKPVDNFEFVSQLAQFSQLQQSQQLNDAMTSLLASQGASQATSLLGRTVTVQRTGGAPDLIGTVMKVSFDTGSPRLLVEDADGNSTTNILISDISAVIQPES